MESLKPIVYFMIDRERYPNDRWLTVTGIIFLDGYSIEMSPSLCTADELTEQMEAMQFLADEAYEHTLGRMAGDSTGGYGGYPQCHRLSDSSLHTGAGQISGAPPEGAR